MISSRDRNVGTTSITPGASCSRRLNARTHPLISVESSSANSTTSPRSPNGRTEAVLDPRVMGGGRRLGIRAKDTQKDRDPRKIQQRRGSRRVVLVAFKVHIKQILPGHLTARPRLQFCEID